MPAEPAAETEPLRRALELHLRSESGPSELRVGPLEPFGDGHSGVTYRVDLNGSGPTGPHVLRLSPDGVRIAGPADVGRQGRIMAALAGAGLPAPPVVACSSQPVISGRSFALMALVDGVSWMEAAARQGHAAVAAAGVAALRRLHAATLPDTGLAGEEPATPGSELERWGGLLRRGLDSIHHDGAGLATALAWAPPAPAPPGLMHGDYHYGNLLFTPSGPAEVVAVVDWELAGLGPVLGDLGCLAVASLRRRYFPEPNPTGDVQVTLAELVDLYGPHAGRDAAWYVALACLKYAAIIGFNLGLHRSGRRLDPIYEELTRTMHGLLVDGRDVLAGKEID